jgi:hypothetical protein
MLGHSHADTTQIYAETNESRASEIARRIGYTLRGHERDIFEPLEIERHQRFQALGVGC